MSEPGTPDREPGAHAAAPAGPTPRPSSWLARALRAVARALLLAFVFGFAVGTLIRCQIERRAPRDLPYLGRVDASSAPEIRLARHGAPTGERRSPD